MTLHSRVEALERAQEGRDKCPGCSQLEQLSVDVDTGDPLNAEVSNAEVSIQYYEAHCTTCGKPLIVKVKMPYCGPAQLHVSIKISATDTTRGYPSLP